MNYQKFIEELPQYYVNWGQDSIYPKSDQFQLFLDRVQGKTTANILQLLNLAVNWMEEDEVYCQISFDRGETVIGALLNHQNCHAYLVEDLSPSQFHEFQVEQLLENLTLFNLEENVYLFDQNFEEFLLEYSDSKNDNKIGVYFYNGSYDYRSQLMSLLLSQPCLSKQALILISNRNFPSTQQAVWDFMAAYPQCHLLLDLPTPGLGSDTFWNGLYVLSWNSRRTNCENFDAFQQSRSPSLLKAIYELRNIGTEETPESIYEEALSCHQQEKFETAERKYKHYLKLEPQNNTAWLNLGILYYSTERYDLALDALEKSLILDDSKAELHYNFGLVYEKLFRLQEAVHFYIRSINCNPNYSDAYNNLGNIFCQEGEFEKAERIYATAIQFNPQHFGSYLNLGTVLMAREKLDEALEVYQKALKEKIEHTDLQHNCNLVKIYKKNPEKLYLEFGNRFYLEGKYQISLQYYQKLFSTELLEPDLYIRLSLCYQEVKQIDHAIETLDRGLERYPQNISLHQQLVKLLLNSGQTQEAIDLLHPISQSNYFSSLILKIQDLLLLPVFYTSFSEIEIYRNRFIKGLTKTKEFSLETVEEVSELIGALGRTSNFYLAYQGYNDRDLQQQYGQFVDRVMSRCYPDWIAPRSMPPLTSQHKIRVGYISGNMGPRRLGELAIGWLRHCDRQQFEVYCYYLDTPIDDLTQKFKQYSNYFYQLTGDLEEIGQQVISNQLHILVFIDIGIDAKITQLASLRLAPIQCTTWVHPVTSGLSTLDYFLSSELMEPDRSEDHYTEKLISLPNIGISYAQPDVPPLDKNRTDFGIDDRRILYLSCQSLFKYLPQHDYIFVEIAQQVPDAQFIFLSHPNLSLTQLFQQRLQKIFADYNLKSEDYCLMLPRLNESDYLRINQLSDIFLDTLSWSGGVTTLKAIACGLPIVTCPGEFMRGRHSFAILKMLGVTDTIARAESDYIEIAVRLGQDSDWRRDLVERIIARRSNIYDDTACVKGLEDFYRRVVDEQQEIERIQ